MGRFFYKSLVDGALHDSVTKLSKQTHLKSAAAKPIYCRKKVNMLFAGLQSVRMVKTCSFQIVTDRRSPTRLIATLMETLALNFGH